MARESIDIALGRGGDQAAVKTVDGFEFYGGISHGVEKRSHVRSRIIANALCDLIKRSDSVIIMGHRMSDLDAVGSAIGVLRICKMCDVPAVIAINSEATLAGPLLKTFLDSGEGHDFIAPDQTLDVITPNTLLIVVDTYQKRLLESQQIYEKCKRVVVIGRSLVIGKPVSLLLLAEHATVTICHSRSENLPEICREADILVVAAADIDFAVVPCLSFDRKGRRLGQGGGYYDRLLPQLHCPTVLICREQLMSPEGPVEEHDMRCTMLVTEKGILTPEA